jgi:hypothetical protein
VKYTRATWRAFLHDRSGAGVSGFGKSMMLRGQEADGVVPYLNVQQQSGGWAQRASCP